jgi:hypothetical protein
MRTEQLTWTEADGWARRGTDLSDEAQLVIAFGGTGRHAAAEGIGFLRSTYPNARVLGCSTAGEICGTTVCDDAIVATAVHLERTRIRGATAEATDSARSYDVGRSIAADLLGEGLVHVFVLSNGIHVNGSELVRGLTEVLPDDVTLTGGLSGDGARFAETWVAWDGDPGSDRVAAIGFYGSDLRVGYGSLGGWDPFGPQRLVTRSEGNVLYELDAQPALDLYKRYLGRHAAELPASGLLFPLAISRAEDRDPVVRTILSVDESDGSMTFAGDVPEGGVARLMKANFDRLIDGAAGAARTCEEAMGGTEPELAILISCVGRKLVLKQRVEEEVEAVRDVLGSDSALTGFYSYGEISPFSPEDRCELHNQTMTITAFAEV